MRLRCRYGERGDPPAAADTRAARTRGAGSDRRRLRDRRRRHDLVLDVLSARALRHALHARSIPVARLGQRGGAALARPRRKERRPDRGRAGRDAREGLGRCPARPAPGHALRMDGERRRHGARRRVVHDAAPHARPDRALRRACRLRLGQRQRVGRRSRARRAATRVRRDGRRQLLPRGRRALPRPQHLPAAGRSDRQHADVRLPRRPRQLLARPGRDQPSVRHPRRAAGSSRTTGRSRS